MELIDNISRLLGDDLKQTLKPGARLKVAASCFSMYAFEALKAELEKMTKAGKLEEDLAAGFFFLQHFSDGLLRIGGLGDGLFLQKDLQQASSVSTEFPDRLGQGILRDAGADQEVIG